MPSVQSWICISSWGAPWPEGGTIRPPATAGSLCLPKPRAKCCVSVCVLFCFLSKSKLWKYPSLVFQLLQQRVDLALRGFDTVCPHYARWPVAVEHENKLLPLQLQLLDLGLQVRVQHLQPLGLLAEDRGGGERENWWAFMSVTRVSHLL